eukprot:1467787-Prymnesium_polylepis.1
MDRARWSGASLLAALSAAQFGTILFPKVVFSENHGQGFRTAVLLGFMESLVVYVRWSRGRRAPVARGTRPTVIL